ncbi:enhancer of mRNA-decapping protein 4-like [Cynara cardunculus var. scolymus]|uniref:enhancer of mRNA-decapping protein 4-like n=1 Tax=Cynara cardunculus var. scolymus TaxID=59895 RepID=UPI000D62629F|nr:enhancer of mRNA-decapping protein 4-like [Cynara cardunculus var. scolymus]
MASPGNPNQLPFDVPRFFNPSSSPPPITTTTTALQNPNKPSPASASASYPPPTVTGGPFSYPPQTNPPLYHPQFNIPPPPFQQQSSDNHLPSSNLHHQRSVPYPTHPLQLQSPSPNNNHHPNTNHGARLMALLSAPPPSTLEPPSMPPPPTQNLMLLSSLHPGPAPLPMPMPMPSSKLPTGRHLNGDRLVYDIDVRLPGEFQPQLEVTPITKYGSDPGLVVGRQIAVNKTYICYGLKQGAIRVLNINTALRSLLKGLAQRVTDMAFFAEEVHLLASASIDGRVYVWKLTESPDEDDKPQISRKIVIAIQITGEGESVHPRVCWHCHKQEVLVVGIGRRILKIDTTKVGRGEVYSAEEPLKCHVDKLLNGVQFVGNHDGEVTDLSMCQWMTTRLVSASVDGTIKIWEDRKQLPIAVLRPHDGLPVNSVTFLTAPHRPDHIILITGGPFNHEMKIWASESEEGWLLPSDADSWHCTQTLELKNSGEPRVEDSFFNQVVALSQAGLLLLANAKKKAIYAVHLDYGPNPEMTRMDYIAEFTVTMPILSLTGTSDSLPHGEQIIQVYCVQTQAIQQYALDLSRCLPPPIDGVVYEKSESIFSHDVVSAEGFTGLESSMGPSSESAPTLRQPLSSPLAEAVISKEFSTSAVEPRSAPPPISNDADISCAVSPQVPLSPRLSRKLSNFRTPSGGFESSAQPNDYGDKKVIEHSVDRQMETAHSNLSSLSSMDDDENKVAKDDGTMVKFKHPTHLVTPAELMAMTTSPSERNRVRDQKSDGELEVQDVEVNSDLQNVDMDVKIVGETGMSHNADLIAQGSPQGFASEHKEKSFCPQASDLGVGKARDRSGLPGETYFVNGSKQLEGTEESKAVVQTSGAQDEVRDVTNDLSGQLETATPTRVKYPAKGKKQKGKNAQGSGPSSPSFNSTDSSNEPGLVSCIPSTETILSQIQSMQETITQVLINQKEIYKQIPVLLTVPVTKEGRRIEAAIGKSMEKAYKANSDAQWARTQEEFSKQEKANRDRHQQISGLVTNGYKDLLATWEKMLKKETAALVPAVVRSVTPLIEKVSSTAISEAFQRGVGDKAVNQLEKSVQSKLEATVARQIQAQFQTSGKQALQEALRLSMEASVVPAFEMSCKAMFDQIDATFQKGMLEHTSAAQQQVESTYSPLAIALRDAINSASSMTRTLSSELADGQRKLVALAVAGANSKGGNPLITQISNGTIACEKIEAPVDPTKELSRLVYEHKYEEAFTAALQRSDVWIVSWLCSQVDLQGILTSNPVPLSQGVLLSLLQQLACDIVNDTSRKLAWMMDLVVAIKPSDGMIAMHVGPIFDQVYSILNHQMSVPNMSVSEVSSIRVVMKLINSTLRTL